MDLSKVYSLSVKSRCEISGGCFLFAFWEFCSQRVTKPYDSYLKLGFSSGKLLIHCLLIECKQVFVGKLLITNTGISNFLPITLY